MDSHPREAGTDHSRSPPRDSADNNRNWDSYGRDRDQGWDRDRRGRSRSPGYDDCTSFYSVNSISLRLTSPKIAGRKRRRSMSPYDRERYESRPRYDDHGLRSESF